MKIILLLHRRISWKCYKKWRMWHLHQTAK